MAGAGAGAGSCPASSAACRAPHALAARLHANTYLYGVLEPHNGTAAARFILQHATAEILFHQFTPACTDDDIAELLRNAFISAEKAYLENYDELIAERTGLQYQLQTLTENEISECGDVRILNRLKEIDQHLSGGATIILALIHYNKLFVANVGEAKALLCKTDDNSVLRVVQLSVDHSLDNEDELLRLHKLGLDVDKLRSGQGLANQQSTRCLGNYVVKALYRAIPDVREATGEPVVAAPDLHPPITLDESCRFLVLVSSAVYKHLQEDRGNTEQVNKQLAQIIVENFRKQTDFKNISQSVLDEIDRQFKQRSVKRSQAPKNYNMALVIRNFNFPMPNALHFDPDVFIVNGRDSLTREQNNSIKGQNNSVRFNPIVQSKSHTFINEDYSSSNEDQRNLTIDSQMSTNRSVSSDSTSDIYPTGRNVYDMNKKIKGYVDFTCYYENVEKARKDGSLPKFME